jgi:hypothetical protein
MLVCRLLLKSGAGSSWKNRRWELRYHGIGRGSDGGVCIAQQLGGSLSGALHRITLVRSER